MIFPKIAKWGVVAGPPTSSRHSPSQPPLTPAAAISRRMDPDEVRRKNRGHADASRKRRREKLGDDEYKRARRAEMVEYRRRKKEEREAAEAEAELEAEAAASEESGQPVEGAAAPLDALASAAEAAHAYDGSAAATLDEARREAAEAVRREEAARREELMAELAALRAQVAAREAAAPAPPHPPPPPYPAAPEPPPPAPPPPPPNAAPAPPRLPAALPSALTEEQRARIEANKQEALRKRAVRERAAAGPPPPTPHAAAAPPPAAPPAQISLLQALRIRKYWGKLVGTAGGWFFFDITFYGNSLFQPTVLKDVFNSTKAAGPTPVTGDLSSNVLAQVAVVAAIGLPGYYVSVGLMDILGRKKIQLQGFFFMAVVFGALGIFDAQLEDAPAVMLILYGLTFFFSNFGPNSTTFCHLAPLAGDPHGSASTWKTLSTVPAPTTRDCTGDGPCSKMYLRQDSGDVNRTSAVPGLNVVTSCHSFSRRRMDASAAKGFGVGLSSSSCSTSRSRRDLSTVRAMRPSPPSPPPPSSARSSSRSAAASAEATDGGAVAESLPARWRWARRWRRAGCSRRAQGRARGLGTTAGSDIATCAVLSRAAARESGVALRDATRKC